MKTYITDEFLLHSPTARELFHDVAAQLPVGAIVRFRVLTPFAEVG